MATGGVQRRVMSILWPAFLMAGVLEMAVFALVDPSSLHWLGGEALGWSATAVYTVAFFVFWAVIAAAGALMRLLDGEPDLINSQGASGAFRR
jgi:hypothetical protein